MSAPRSTTCAQAQSLDQMVSLTRLYGFFCTTTHAAPHFA
jgi:hypothetical protein